MPDRTPTEGALILLATGVTKLPPDELPGLVTRAAEMAGATDVVILLIDLDQRHLRSFGRSEPLDLDVDHTAPGAAYRQERTLVVAVGEEGVDAVRLWLPIMDSAERLGVLGVTVAGLDPDLHFWQAMASLLGESLVCKSAYGDIIELTRRSMDLTLAAEMRWTTLPPLTFTNDRVDISGILQPAYEIAGDAFDYAISSGHLDLGLIDAMGHGLEASQMANLAIGEYRHGRRNGRPFGELLRSMDEVVATQFGDSRYVTGQLAHLDLDDGELRILNAGHPRPLLFRDGEDVGDLDCKPCPPMGLGLVEAETATVHLTPGDVVLFHTDGVTEARAPDGSEWGRDRLAGVVASRLGADDRPAEVLRRAVHAAEAYAVTGLGDDACLVFLRWNG